MTIYSLYIFDRHCTCVYYQDWHRLKQPKPAAPGAILPAVSSAVSFQAPSKASGIGSGSGGSPSTPRNSQSTVTSSSSLASEPPAQGAILQRPQQVSSLPFDEEAKLVYGVILSLRNMIRKLSGREEQFLGYKTSTYKLHNFETATGYKFVMLSDPDAESLRPVLGQIYTGSFIEYVVHNPLASMDSKEHGIDNEYFRASIDRLVRSLPMFQ